MSTNVTLSPAAYEILTRLIARADTDQRVTRAMTESDLVELALRVFEIAEPIPDNTLRSVFGLAVAQFELSKVEGS